MAGLDLLFSPITIRGKTIRNRLAVSPMSSNFCDAEGKATERYIAYHETKAKEGRFEEIRRCIGCNDGCIHSVFHGGSIRCVLNPTMGREHEGPAKRAKQPKKVAVIGAGPSGLYAAITAREAGHDVTDYEQESHAGGQFYLASIPPSKSEITDCLRWLVSQCERLGVPIQYNTAATVDMMKKVKPDVIVEATGAVPVMPPIPGIDHACVYNAHDVAVGKVFPGKRCVVAGGRQVGIETAHHLAVMLRDVVVLEGGPEICPQEEISARMKLFSILKERDVRL